MPLSRFYQPLSVGNVFIFFTLIALMSITPYLTSAWYAMICPLILSLLLTTHVWNVCCQPNPSSLCRYGKTTDLYGMGAVSCVHAAIDRAVLADCGHLCRLVNANRPSPPCHWRIFWLSAVAHRVSVATSFTAFLQRPTSVRRGATSS